MESRTCGGYLCSPLSCTPELCYKCYKCCNKSIPSHTRLALNEFQTSCYSYHRSQFALSETNWLLRVLGCNPYLKLKVKHTKPNKHERNSSIMKSRASLGQATGSRLGETVIREPCETRGFSLNRVATRLSEDTPRPKRASLPELHM